VDEYRTMTGDWLAAADGFARAWGAERPYVYKPTAGKGERAFFLPGCRATFRVVPRSPGWAVVEIDSGRKQYPQE
jgi:hypothetical protein